MAITINRVMANSNHWQNKQIKFRRSELEQLNAASIAAGYRNSHAALRAMGLDLIASKAPKSA